MGMAVVLKPYHQESQIPPLSVLSRWADHCGRPSPTARVFDRPSVISQADVEVGPQRTRNLSGKELAQALASDAANHFAYQVPVGRPVVARSRPGFPPRHLRCEFGSRIVPVLQVLDGDRLVPTREARGV